MAEGFVLPALGWDRPDNSSRYHVFNVKDARSLCNKWVLRGVKDEHAADLAATSDNECAACRKKLDGWLRRATVTLKEAGKRDDGL